MGYRSQNTDADARNLPPIGHNAGHKQHAPAAALTQRQKPHGSNISLGGPSVFHYKMAQQLPAATSFRNPPANAQVAAAARHGGIGAASHHAQPHHAGGTKPPQLNERKGWGYSAAGGPAKYVSPYSQRYLTKDGKAL